MTDPSPFDKRCLDLLDASPKRQSRHCLRSALHHLDCATRLRGIDNAMAAFRGLTAEEEAASGFMHCLKERGYENAQRLKPRDHVHKNAITPFLDVLGLFFHETIRGQLADEPVLRLDGEGAETKLLIALPMLVDGETKLVQPIPPFSFSVTSASRPLSYRRQIDEFVRNRGAKSISDHLRAQANLRNELLYAGPNGYPSDVDLPDEFFDTRRVRVMALIRGYLLVQPYAEKLPFVQDALNAFLAMLGALPEHDLHPEL